MVEEARIRPITSLSTNTDEVRRPPSFLKRATRNVGAMIGIILLVGITFVAGYVASMAFAFRNPAVMYNQWELLKYMSSLSPWENPLVLGIDIFSMGGALLLGIAGLLLLKRSGKKRDKHTSNKTNT